MTNKMTYVFLITAMVLGSGCNPPGSKTNPNSLPPVTTSNPVLPTTANAMYKLAVDFSTGQADEAAFRTTFAVFNQNPSDLNTLADQGAHDFALLVAKAPQSADCDGIINTFLSDIGDDKAQLQVKAIMANNSTDKTPFVRIMDTTNGLRDRMAQIHWQTAKLSGHTLEKTLDEIDGEITAAANSNLNDIQKAYVRFLGVLFLQTSDSDLKELSEWSYMKVDDENQVATIFSLTYNNKGPAEQKIMRQSLLAKAAINDGIGTINRGVIHVIKKNFLPVEALKEQYDLHGTGEADLYNSILGYAHEPRESKSLLRLITSLTGGEANTNDNDEDWATTFSLFPDADGN